MVTLNSTWEYVRERPHPLALIAAWVMVMVSLPILRWIWGDSVLQGGVVLGVLLQVGAVIATLNISWRLPRIVGILLLIAAFTLLVEAIGTASGWPFGAYHYTELLQPQLARVPLLIPAAWFMMVPPAWSTAVRFRHNRFAFAAVSALALTAWDLFLDPQMVAWGFWVWSTPGSYFGIPLINYAGWFLTAFVLNAILYPIARDLYRPMPLLLIIYTITWFLEAVGLAFFWGMPGPALVGAVVMGGFVTLGWRTQTAGRRPVLS